MQIQKKCPSLPPPLKKPHEQKRKQRLEIKQKQTKQRKKRKKEIKRTPSTINYSWYELKHI